METIGSLQHMPRERLSSLLLQQSSSQATAPSSSSSPIAIIDVRDDDHIGGHIANSTHIPSNTFHRPTQISSLVRSLRSKSIVVFHCALSQQRGPRAALAYLRARNDVLAEEKKGKAVEGEEKLEGMDGLASVPNEEVEGVVRRAGGEGSGADGDGEGVGFVGESNHQDVYVLDGGFVKWQEKYGDDKRLTSAYQKDVWRFGY